MDYGIWFFLAGFVLAAVGMAFTLHRDSKTISSIQAIANSKNDIVRAQGAHIDHLSCDIAKTNLQISNLNSKVNELVSTAQPKINNDIIYKDLEHLLDKTGDLEKMCKNIDTEVEFMRQQMRGYNRPKTPQQIELTVFDGGKAPKNQPQKELFKKVKSQLSELEK